MEGRTHYERIIGGTKQEKEVALRELQDAFERKSMRLSEHEIEKSPEDLETLKKIESVVDRIVVQYGGTPKPLPLDNIYILKPGSISAMTGGKLDGGIHQPLGLKIGVENENSKLSFASGVAHELFHLKSYKSARVGKSGEDVRLYRTGLSMIDRKDPNKEMGDERDYFAEMEEAIVTECTDKFLQEISEDGEFSEEAKAIKKFKDWVVAHYRSIGISEEAIKEFEKEFKYITRPQDIVKQVLAYSDEEGKRSAYAAGTFSALYKKGEVETLERHRERKKLYELLDGLVEQFGGTFKNRDEFFDEFAKANFTGNYLPLARLIEVAFGKGAFRALAKKFSKEPS